MKQETASQPQGSAERSNVSLTVVLIGHCVPDAFLLRSTVQRALPAASIVMVNDESVVRGEHWRPDRVLLVNRVLDGDFSVEGLDLIGEAAADDGGPIALLISDFEDAQQAALEAGGLSGFGKRELYAPETVVKLCTAVKHALDAAARIDER